jgi:hypothetical protein
MKRSYYKGIALDFKAQECENECSLRDYCNKCCTEYTSSCCTNTTIVDGTEVRKQEESYPWSCLKRIIPFGWWN